MSKQPLPMGQQIDPQSKPIGQRTNIERGQWREELTKKHPLHPVADMFPPMDIDDFQALCDSIVDHGLLEPIVTLNDAIVDGRNRFLACLNLEIEPKFVEFDESAWACSEDGLSDFVFVKNVHRRHLSKEAKIGMAVKLREQGWNQFKIADALKVNQSTITRWLKDNMQMHNTENGSTAKDSLGRNRPTNYKKNQDDDENREQSIPEIRALAIEDLEKWKTTYAKLELPMLNEIAKRVLTIGE